jgi:L-asparagine transporter-like permease
MIWNKWIPQIHHWLAPAFTVAVIVNIVAAAQGKYANWVGLLAVAPLALLLPTGLYMFAMPYGIRWRSRRRAVNTNTDFQGLGTREEKRA